jgi:SAM-dependent methyltransferase
MPPSDLSLSASPVRSSIRPDLSGQDWSTPSFAAQLSLAQSLRWMVDTFETSDGEVTVSGWFLSPFHDPSSARFMVNDTVVVSPDHVHGAHGDVQKIVPDLPDCAYRFSLQVSTPGGSDFTSVRFLPSGALSDTSIYGSSWFLLDPAKENDPLPQGENIYRVIATQDSFYYRMGGATVANRINEYLNRTQGNSVANIGPVLDWGSGCARVSRYLRRLGCRELFGADVDAANVGWCTANVPWLSAEHIALNPPTPFASNTFGLVVGISVFTHLREPSQFAWLSEIHRILRPGGTAIVTVMREGQIALQGGTAAFMQQLAVQGFIMVDDNDQLRLGEGDENYYVNVYHSAEYIFRNWERELEVVDIVPFLGAHQDAVVLRKRG